MPCCLLVAVDQWQLPMPAVLHLLVLDGMHLQRWGLCAAPAPGEGMSRGCGEGTSRQRLLQPHTTPNTFMATMEDPQKKNGDMSKSKLPSCSRGTSSRTGLAAVVDGVSLTQEVLLPVPARCNAPSTSSIGVEVVAGS